VTWHWAIESGHHLLLLTPSLGPTTLTPSERDPPPLSMGPHPHLVGPHPHLVGPHTSQGDLERAMEQLAPLQKLIDTSDGNDERTRLALRAQRKKLVDAALIGMKTVRAVT
jgi:hypothetical protein